MEESINPSLENLEGGLDDRMIRFVDALPVSVGIANAEGQIVHVNPVYVELFGYAPDQIPTVEAWFDLAYPDEAYQQEVRRRWQDSIDEAAVNNGNIASNEYRVCCKNGEDRIVEISGALIGNLVFVLIYDRTWERMQEQELRHEMNFREAIIDHAADGICVCHNVEDYPYVYFTVWSARMVEITGYTLEEINEMGWYQSLYQDPQVREKAIARMELMREGNNLKAEEWEITHKDGSGRIIAISTSVLQSEDGTAHVLGLMQDVTEKHQARIEREALNRQMQNAQKLESLGVLAGGIAHDFNNILAAILGHVEEVIEETDREHQSFADLDGIRIAALRAAELTNQMLAYAGKGQFVIEPLNLNDLVEGMVQLLRTSLPKTAQFQLDLDDVAPIKADAAQLRQVVMNLVTNAAESLPDSGGDVTVTTRMVTLGEGELENNVPHSTGETEQVMSGTYVHLCVKDTGCGMNEATKDRIFEPFFTTKFTGRGLGLAATLGIVKGHGGLLCLNSEVGKGTSFDIYLPAKEGLVVKEAIKDVQANSQLQGSVLIVDDEASVRKVLQQTLESFGLAVMAVDSGEAGLAKYKAHTFNLVFVDMTMPGMNGAATIKAMRTIRTGTPLIAMSGYSIPEADADDFIQKPFGRSHLLDMVQKILGGE